jgi:hypothetical protein
MASSASLSPRSLSACPFVFLVVSGLGSMPPLLLLLPAR